MTEDLESFAARSGRMACLICPLLMWRRCTKTASSSSATCLSMSWLRKSDHLRTQRQNLSWSSRETQRSTDPTKMSSNGSTCQCFALKSGNNFRTCTTSTRWILIKDPWDMNVASPQLCTHRWNLCCSCRASMGLLNIHLKTYVPNHFNNELKLPSAGPHGHQV